MFVVRLCLYVRILGLFGLLHCSHIVASESGENNTGTSLIEDEYVEHFGKEIGEIKPWKIINAWYYEVGTSKLKGMCAEAHVRAGYVKEVPAISTIRLEWILRKLNFTNENYESREIDVIKYTVVEEKSLSPKERVFFSFKESTRAWSFTEGTRKDCVYYLNPHGERDMQYKLQRHVCGIKSARELYTTVYVEEESVSDELT